jgi:hypothetical protein
MATAEREGEYEIEPDTVFPGRLIAKNSDDDECLDLAASWMEKCSRYHGRPCYKQSDGPLPTRLICIPENVHYQLRLVNTEGQTGRYVALSHCWGEGIDTRTLKALLKARENGFSFRTLPQSFRDAVRVAHRLGFRYIWIDALCIIQDSPDDWARESSKMAAVYGNASLTICAQLAPHGKHGFLRDREAIHSPAFGEHEKFSLQTRDEGWVNILANPLNDRGWTHQERFISPRKLHYLREQLAWECPRAIYLEEYRGNYRPGTHFSVTLFKDFHESIANTKLRKQHFPIEVTRDSMFRVFDWNHCVEEWSVRQFTYITDKLPSLSGLASAAAAPDLGSYLAGLWEHCLFISMGYFPAEFQSTHNSTTYRGPSWSWPSWDASALHLSSCIRTKSVPPPEWYQWADKFHPKLISHRIVPRTALDPKGEVLDESHLVVQGHCRDVYIRDNPDTEFDPAAFRCNNYCEPGRECWDTSDPELANPPHGRRVRMDMMENKNDKIVYFEEDLKQLKGEIDVSSLQKHTCFQITRQWRKNSFQVLALIIQPTGKVENEFKRAGLLAFDDDDLESPKWKSKTFRFV